MKNYISGLLLFVISSASFAYTFEPIALNIKQGNVVTLSGDMEKYLKSHCHLRIEGINVSPRSNWKVGETSFVAYGTLKQVAEHTSKPAYPDWSTYSAVDSAGRKYQVGTYLNNIGSLEGNNQINLVGACAAW